MTGEWKGGKRKDREDKVRGKGGVLPAASAPSSSVCVLLAVCLTVTFSGSTALVR